jgi:SAM-dependent methyltransferase
VEISDRSAALLEGVDLDGEVGLEIGPLDKPVVRRKEGRPIYYADYTSREALCAKSADDPNVDVTLIPEIDYLIAGLPQRLDRTFDYILASHVIEHVPDLVGWLEALFGWLSPGGRVILAVPDKRYCFDLLRALSTTGQVIEAHLQRRERPGCISTWGALGGRTRIAARSNRCSRQRSPITPPSARTRRASTSIAIAGCSPTAPSCRSSAS